MDNTKRAVISKEQYKTREDLQKMVEEDKKKDDFKPYESPARDKYKPYDSPARDKYGSPARDKYGSPAKDKYAKEDSMDYAPYDSRAGKKRRDSYGKRERSASNEKRRQPYETAEKEKIELGKYDSFSNAGSRDHEKEPVKKAGITEPVVFKRRKESVEETPKADRPFGVFDRRDSLEDEERPKRNFVESKNVSRAPVGEQNLETDLMIVTLKMIIANQRRKIEELEDKTKELEARGTDKDQKIRDLEEKIDDLETMGKLKDFTGDNTVDVPHLDEKLKNIDEYLDGIKYNPEQNKLIEDIIKKNQEYSDLSKENASAMAKLRNNISNLKSTLSTLNVGD